LKELLELVKERSYAEAQGQKLIDAMTEYMRAQLQYDQGHISHLDYIRSFKRFLSTCIEVLDYLEKDETERLDSKKNKKSFL